MRVAAVIAMAVLSASAEAQRRETVDIPLPGPRMLVGFVADTADGPLDSVEVFISSLKRSTLTGPDGSFRFEDVKPGKYQVGARRLGFYPSAKPVTVGEKGGATAFWLVPRSATLPTIVSSATRGGLSGVIGDTAFNIIEGANIWVLASDRRTRSDSTGSFFLDLKPGRHMVRVERAGYGSKLLSVNIPDDSGRRVVVWLAPASRGAAARETQAIFNFSMRLTRRNPVWSKIYTREDIARSRIDRVTQLATAGAGKRVDENCMAVIDGGPVVEPLWVLDAADVETMEVYTTRPPRRTVRSIDSRGTQSRMQPLGLDCGVQVFVWLRK